MITVLLFAAIMPVSAQIAPPPANRDANTPAVNTPNSGVGPVVAAGWLVATLTGAAAGGATGGIIGALSQHAGLSKEEAEVYSEGLRRGGAVVSAKVPDADAARLQSIMDRSAVQVADRMAAYRKSGWTTFSPTAKPYTRDEVIKERTLYRVARGFDQLQSYNSPGKSFGLLSVPVTCGPQQRKPLASSRSPKPGLGHKLTWAECCDHVR